MKFVYFTVILCLTLSFTPAGFAKEPTPKHRSTKHSIKHRPKAKKSATITQSPVRRIVANPKRTKSTPIQSAPVIVGAQQLRNEIDNVIRAMNLDAYIGVYVKSMKDGAVLYTRNINQPLMPASTLKILTAEAALLFLGSDYRFSTQLLTDAKAIKNGVLQGNLYIVLSGDPTLTYYALIDLLMNLKTQQIRAIAGNVYIDDTAYDRDFHGPGWVEKDKQYCWAAPISASIIDRNCIAFEVASSKSTSRPPQVILSPRYFYPSIRNLVTTKSIKGCGLHLTEGNAGDLTLEGCMPPGNRSWGVTHVLVNIPEYDRALFKNLLNRLGVAVYGTVTFGTAPETLSLLNSHSSKPLSLLINDMLKKSDNIIAGALFKKVGELYTRQPGSWANGGFAVTQILNKYAGVDTTGMRVLDGSGLSPNNQTTPAQMMQVLDFAYHHYPTSYEFVSALPIAGVDGTLKNRMSNIARKVRAKTGTISGVIALAGYAVSADRSPLAFVIMVNGTKGMGWRYKELEDRIATLLTRYRDNS